MAQQVKALRFMSLKTPEIGIALAAYEPKEEYFLLQLNSIQDQDFHNWTCIITLDSDLPKFLESNRFAHIVSDPRFHFIKNELRLGHKKNFQAAAECACNLYPSIKYLAFSDQDDIWYSNKISTSLEALKKLPPYSAVHTDMHLLLPENGKHLILQDSPGKNVSGWKYEGKLNHFGSVTKWIACNQVAGAAMLIDKRIILEYGEIPDFFEYHDHWYSLVALLLGALQAIPTQTYAYRQHEHNVIGASKRVGLLTIRSQKNLSELFNTWVTRFQCFRRRASFVLEHFPQHRSRLWLSYLNPIDPGIFLMLSGLDSYFRGDTRTARPLLGAALGKALTMLSSRTSAKSKS